MSREWIIDDDFLDEETKLSADGQGYLTELVRCKDCKYYKEDVWAEVNNVPLIVAHEMCEFWGGGCKTSENGYCSFGERADNGRKDR